MKLSESEMDEPEDVREKLGTFLSRYAEGSPIPRVLSEPDKEARRKAGGRERNG